MYEFYRLSAKTARATNLPNWGAIAMFIGIFSCAPSHDTGGPVGVLPPDVIGLDLGQVEVSAGVSDEVEFLLPANVDSFMVFLEAAEGQQAFISTLSGPTGPLVMDTYRPETPESERELLDRRGPQRMSPNPSVSASEISSTLVPNGSSMQPVGGLHRIVVGASDLVGREIDTRVHAWVLYREVEVRRGVLDVHLYLTGAAGWTAENATEAPALQQALDEARAIFERADIALRIVDISDVPTRFATIEDASGPGDLAELFEFGSGQESGLGLFIVDRFVAPLAGTSGGIPGPAFSPGRASSGVAVAWQEAEDDPSRLARVIAHEVAHWLGLFHTSQRGLFADPIADTPVGEGERDNLMFAELEGGLIITPDQARVLRRHLEIRPE